MVLPYDNMDYGEDQVGARNIPELTDVELTNLANGEVLKYNSSNNKWENQTIILGGVDSISTLTDTNITTPILNGSFLVYNTSNGKWENFVVLDLDTLNNLSDTNISSVADKDFLLYDNASSKWINTPSIIDNLKNVSILSVADKEILKYNSTSGKWENNNLLINEINDVNITSLQNGEVLKYNSSSSKWENQDNTDTLNELTDVTLTGSSNNQVLKYNGSIWVNNFVNLTELADTNIPALNNGDILRYNSSTGKWETNTFNIDDLDNVNITSVANNEVLKYNSTSGKWANQTETTYSAGTGVTINGSNQISIGQAVATSDSPSFNQLSLGVAGTNQGIINLKDVTNIGTDTVAQIKGILNGNNGGDLQFYTKVDGSSLTEKLRINNVGAIGIGGANFGSSGQVLTSNGSGSSVSWASPIPYHLVFGLSPNSGTIYYFSSNVTTIITRLFVRTGESPTTTYNTDLTSSTYWSPSVSGIFQINIHANFAASNLDQLAYSALLLEKSTTGSSGTFTNVASSTDRRFGTNQNATDAQAVVNTNNLSHTFNVATTDTFRIRVLAITKNNVNPWIYADEGTFKVSITKIA